MSVVEDTEQDRGAVLHYAPRRVRFPAEQQSIRPILERLRRSEDDTLADAQAKPLRIEHAIPLEPPRKAIGWQLLVCSALSAGLSAALAVLAVGWLAPTNNEFTRIEAIRLDPKSVHTVSFKQDAPAVPRTETDLQKQAPESAPPIQPKDAPPPSKTEAHKDQVTPKELLALWSGIPADLHPDVTANADASAPVSGGTDAEAPPAAPSEHRTVVPTRQAHARHRSHVRRRAVEHTHARTTGQSASAAAQTANPNSLQSAFQSLFGQPAAGAAPTQSGATAAPASASNH